MTKNPQGKPADQRSHPTKYSTPMISNSKWCFSFLGGSCSPIFLFVIQTLFWFHSWRYWFFIRDHFCRFPMWVWVKGPCFFLMRICGIWVYQGAPSLTWFDQLLVVKHPTCSAHFLDGTANEAWWTPPPTLRSYPKWSHCYPWYFNILTYDIIYVYLCLSISISISVTISISIYLPIYLPI